MNIDKKKNLLAVSTGDGRDTHQAGWELWFVVVLTEDFFRLWAWIWSLRGKGTFLMPCSWYVMIYSWRHSVPVLTWQLTQLLPVLEDISCGSFMIFQHPRLIGQNNVPSWHGVFWPLNQYSCNIVPSRHLVCRGGKGIVDLCSRCLGGTSPPGCAKPASSVAMRIPSVSHSFPSHFIDPKAPWVTLAPCRPCRLFFPFLMLKLPISAPHFEIVSLNPGIRWIGVTRAWVAGA